MRSIVFVLLLSLVGCGSASNNPTAKVSIKEPVQPTSPDPGYPILIPANELKGVYYSESQVIYKLTIIDFKYCVTVNSKRIWNGFGPCDNLVGPAIIPIGQMNGVEWLRLLDMANASQYCLQVKTLTNQIIPVPATAAKFGPCQTLVENSNHTFQ